MIREALEKGGYLGYTGFSRYGTKEYFMPSGLLLKSLKAINKIIERLDHARDTTISTLVLLADKHREQTG